MGRDDIAKVLRATLAVMGKIADGTRTQADNLMVSILKSNEARLAEAIETLLADPTQPLSDERVSAALKAVGIRA